MRAKTKHFLAPRLHPDRRSGWKRRDYGKGRNRYHPVSVWQDTTNMNVNRHTLVALAAVTGALSLQPLMHAADAKESAPPAAEGRAGALRERMQETARELNLTDEQKQKQKLQTIVRERMEKLRDLRADNSLSREEKMEKFKAAREEIFVEVKKVLTPEQFEKWKAKQGRLPSGAGAASGPGARLQEAIKDLNLTDAQKEQLKPIYREQMEKLRELRQDNSLSMAEKLEKLKTVRQEIAPKLKKVMDAEQFAKWEKDVKQWLEQLKQRFQELKQR
jgi:Spy/CpxP family protein refolding chaperone